MKDTRQYETLPVGRLFWRAILPSILSSLVWGVANVWEGINVGQSMGQEALAAISLSMPFAMISMALADLIASGASLQISLHLGRKDDGKAREIFTSACIMIEVLSFLLGCIYFFFGEGILRLMGAEESVVLLAADYLKVFGLLAPISMIFFGADDFLRICGKVKYSMIANLCVCFVNIFLAWLLVGHLKLGLIASSAVFSGCFALGSILCFIPLLRGKLVLKLTRPRLSFMMLKRILAGGLPTFFANLAASFMGMFTNAAVIRLGGTVAISALSIKNYVDAFARILLNGMSMALRPALGYNYGAKRLDRVADIGKRLLLVSALLAGGIFAALELGGGAIVSIFCQAGDVSLAALGVRAVKICAFSYLFLWFTFMSGMFFSALDRPSYSLALSVLRTFAFPGGALLLLPLAFGLDGVWISFVASECLAALLSLAVLFRIYFLLWKKPGEETKEDIKEEANA